MAVSVGISLSLKSFIDQFLSFAVLNAGFSDSGTVVMTAGGGNVDAHSITKGGVTWVFTTGQTSELVDGFGTNRLQARMCYSVPVASSAWSRSNPVGQPEMTAFSVFNSGLTFSSPHYFFTNGNSCHAVIEIFPNIFSHLSFGSLEKYGSYDGGEYLTSTDLGYRPYGLYLLNRYQNQMIWSEYTELHPSQDKFGYVRYSRGGTPDENDFAPLGRTKNPTTGGNAQHAKGVINPSEAYSSPGDGIGYCGAMFTCSPNAANLRSPLIPIYVRLRNITSPSVRFHLAGFPEGVRLINMKELDPKSIVDNNWQVFPLSQKIGDQSVAALSGNLALAYNTSL